MVRWRCFQCQEDMVKDMVEVEFEGLKDSVEGIRCPKCGTKYILEDTVLEKLLKVEGEVGWK